MSLTAAFGAVSVVDIPVPVGATCVRLDPLGIAFTLVHVSVNGHIGARAHVYCGSQEAAEVIVGISSHIRQSASVFGATTPVELRLSDVGVSRVCLHVRPAGFATQAVALHVVEP
jgi:hypothetical protein